MFFLVNTRLYFTICSFFLLNCFFKLPCEPICESIEPVAAPTKAPVTPAPTKAPLTQAPTDCYDLFGITEEDIINQIGSDEPIPVDAIKIIHGENTNVTIGK